MAAIAASIMSYLFPPEIGESEETPMKLQAVPGLTTVLDVALFRANEGQLTATICCSHALLACWLDTKHQAQLLLNLLGTFFRGETFEPDNPRKIQCETFARLCLDCAMDAVERLSTDKFAQSANLSDPYESISSVAASAHHSATQQLSGVGAQGVPAGVVDSKDETGRRIPVQRRKDCWESPRLFCPDHVWADDSHMACQRWLRQLAKHPFVQNDKDSVSPLSPTSSSIASGLRGAGGSSKNQSLIGGCLSPRLEREASILIQLVLEDLPMRLHHFRQAMEAEAVVTKRLYLVKSEYRAPFRAFLEAHQTLLKAPHMSLVESYLQDRSSKKKASQEKELEVLLKTPALIELLALERECELMEIEMGQTLFPFSEFARSLDHKKVRIKPVKGILDETQLPTIQESIRRLKCILCRKAVAETSTGIRPVLLDLQGVQRDDGIDISGTSKTTEERIDEFLWQLHCIASLLKTPKNAFATIKNTSTHNASHHHHHHGHNESSNNTVEFSALVTKGCTETFDGELLKCQLLDWMDMVQRQHVLQGENEGLPDKIRQAEMAMSIAGASEQSLQKVREKLEKMQTDRQQRLEVLQELLEDLCLREMNLHIDLEGPEPTKSLILKETPAVGFLGIPLQLAGEPLPIG